jgi:hypothetical protein
MKFFHVTLNANSAPIQLNGIDPMLSQGKLKAIWGCTESKLPWAIAHISAKYNVSPENLCVFCVNVQPKRLTHTRLRGVYTCKTILKPTYPPTNAAVIVSRERE